MNECERRRHTCNSLAIIPLSAFLSLSSAFLFLLPSEHVVWLGLQFLSDHALLAGGGNGQHDRDLLILWNTTLFEDIPLWKLRFTYSMTYALMMSV